MRASDLPTWEAESTDKAAAWALRLSVAGPARAEAVQAIGQEHASGGGSVRRTALRLGVRESTLRGWAAQVPELAAVLRSGP